mmetsp:Transcript_10321/g.28105  ORF Transcript_10321/g.28105 Transcript_10321/m.28105 type:complete len:176 (+) Transcript_10321:32-559(+)
MSRVFLALVALLGLFTTSVAGAWPFGGGGKPGDAPVQGGGGDPLSSLAGVSAEELQQAQAMMRDPQFMQQMLSQMQDPQFISQLKQSLASPEARATMEKMGMKVPTEEEMEEALAKLQSPEFQQQLKTRAEALQAAASAYQQQAGAAASGDKMAQSKLGNTKVDASGQQAAAIEG